MINLIVVYILIEFPNLLRINLMHSWGRKNFLGSEERKAVINNFVLSNFNSCSSVWMLTSAKSFRKFGAIQKRALGFIIDNYAKAHTKICRIKLGSIIWT